MTTYQATSLERVRSKPGFGRVARLVAVLLGVGAGVLAFTPWRQSVSGPGQVIVFDAMDRPQPIEAQIPGRIVAWRVQEGDQVKEGDLIAEITDTDSKFLDDAQPKRLQEQRDFAQRTASESERRVQELLSQKGRLEDSRVKALAAQQQAIRQAMQREKAAEQAVKQAAQNLKIAQNVADQAAGERARQAEDRVDQAERALEAARQQAETMRLRKVRVAELLAKGLRSQQDLEFAANDLVKAETERARAEKSLEIARKDVNVGRLAQSQVTLEIERAQAAVDQAKASLEVAKMDVVNARLNLSKLEADTSAALNRVAADVQSARESAAKNSGDVRKVDIDLGNLTVRRTQQEVRAPRDGRIVRLMKVGAGATVKAGDQLAVLAPDTPDRAVELYLADNDVPLVKVGSPVRLQFAGWPSLQFDGYPSAAIGTFGGRVAVIDAVDDGSARYRVVVKPDRHRLATGKLDQPWPEPDLLRPGAEVAGWVMLDKVPLGFELWRQFNGFPASRMTRPKLTDKKGTSVVPAKKDKDAQLGEIKLKAK